jgi:TctA family transporter
MMQANMRFPVLSMLAKIIFIVGVLALLIGLFSGVKEFIEFTKLSGQQNSNWSFETKDYIYIASFIFNTITGLVVMAVAEIIGVLFAIEFNTRTNNN